MGGNSWSLPFNLDPVIERRKPNHEMRIGFGNASEENIREGIKRLGKVLREFV